jgi:hemin uptake protein HemP
MDRRNPLQPPVPSVRDAGASAPARRIDSVDLLGARGELVIVHAGREYRLRITQNNKLILTA